MSDDFLGLYKSLNARSSAKSEINKQFKLFEYYKQSGNYTAFDSYIPTTFPDSVEAFNLVMEVNFPGQPVRRPPVVKQPKDPWRKEHKRRKYPL